MRRPWASDVHSDPAPAAAPPQLDIHAYQLIPRQSADRAHPLPNRDLDTGQPTRPAGYRLTDDTYATLLHRLAATPTQPIPPGIKRDILAYYADPSLNFATKKNPDAWTTAQKDLTAFRVIPTTLEPLPYPTYGDGSGDAPPDTGQQPQDLAVPSGR